MPLARELVFRICKLAAAAAFASALLAAQACGADPDALRRIVQDQCVVHWTEQHDPAPCLSVTLADPRREDSGYAVLADRKGGAHFLLIPTRRIIGIESPELLQPKAPNYLAAAWQARAQLAAVVGHAVPREAVALAVNPVRARSQSQLHIHIECLRPDVFASLKMNAREITDRWSPLRIGAADFDVLRIAGEELGNSNPFKLLSERASQEHHAMGDYTLLIAGTQSKSGPGVILLASTGAAGELLLDSACAAANG